MILKYGIDKEHCLFRKSTLCPRDKDRKDTRVSKDNCTLYYLVGVTSSKVNSGFSFF